MKRICFMCAAAFVLIPLLLTACQPTPESVAVIQAGDFLENLQAVPFEPYEAPERAEYETDIPELAVIFDAEVIVPEASAYSIVELEQVKFTEADYRRFMEHFCPGAEWFDVPERTKAEIIEDYWAIQNNTRMPEEQKAQFDSLLQEAESAPETVELVPFDLSAHLREEYGFVAQSDRCEGSERPSTFSVSPLQYAWGYSRTQSGTVYRQSYLDFNLEEDIYMAEDFKRDPNISQAEAVSIAEEAVRALGFDPAIKLHSAEKGITYRNLWPVTYGWQCIFTREYGGIQAPDPFLGYWNTWKNSPPPSYAAPWPRENIAVFVDDSGIDVFSVLGISREKEVLYKNVALLPFDALLERIEKQLKYQHAYAQEGITDKMCRVTSIELLGSVIAEKDKAGFGLFIPSWRVEYALSYTEYGTEIVLDGNATYFNAIDGSYIEPRASAEMLGYDS